VFGLGGKQKIDIKGSCCVKITGEKVNINSGGCAPTACDAEPKEVSDSYGSPSSGASGPAASTGTTGGGC
jgi:hypothetical protein